MPMFPWLIFCLTGLMNAFGLCRLTQGEAENSVAVWK
jgi:hypothetical protein